MTVSVVINDLFTKANKDLDKAVKGKVLDFMEKLQVNPGSPGLDLKRPQGAIDRRVRTARVDKFWRAVLFELPESAGFVLVSVRPHDDAYDFASGLRLEVNAATGILELIDATKLDDATKLEQDGASDRSAGEQPQPLLAGISVTKLKAFGISDPVIAKALAITDQSELNALCDVLPTVQGLALLALNDRRDPDEVYVELIGQAPQEPIDTEDFTAALQRPASRLQFAPGSNEELQAAIEGTLQAWRVWLHPVQRSLAYRDGFNGPVRVTGGAGTGKTVTALHRARYLGDGARAAGETKPAVLLATFTRNLADTLSSQLDTLAGRDMSPQVDVVNLDALAYRILARTTRGRLSLTSTTDPDIRRIWRIAGSRSGVDPTFLVDEWSDVVLANGITEQAEYLRVARPGRGKALNRAGRLRVWSAIQQALQDMSATGIMTHAQAALEAARIAGSDPSLRYRHGIIDEAQDLHPAHWRLVRALVPPGPDDLFIVGDAHQRIYGKPVVLSRFGIETRGRSRRLTINYRTSREILRWSLAVMSGVTVDDLDGQEETLGGARSEFSGPAPKAVQTGTIKEEDAALVETLKGWLSEGFQPGDIGVLSRERTGVDAAVEGLRASGISADVVDRYDTVANPGNVQVMTMHRSKGLEFTCVAITRLGNAQFPPRFVKRLPDDQRSLQLAQERAALYVAGTRARERLALLHTGPEGVVG